jgi:hypothetical protein
MDFAVEHYVVPEHAESARELLERRGLVVAVMQPGQDWCDDVSGTSRPVSHTSKDNGVALCKVCAQFIMLCRALDLSLHAARTRATR